MGVHDDFLVTKQQWPHPMPAAGGVLKVEKQDRSSQAP